MQGLGTDHSPVALAQGVAAHLATLHWPVALPTKAGSPFHFGWRRPTSVDEREATLRKLKASWRLSPPLKKLAGQSVAFLVVAGAFSGLVTAAFTCANLAGAWGKSLHMGIDGQNLLAGGALFSVLGAGVLFAAAAVDIIDRRAAVTKTLPLVTPSTPDMSEWFTGDLEHEDVDYLRYPSTRAYLSAVLASPLPQLMAGDVQQLEGLFQREKEKVALAQEAWEAQKADEAHQQSLQRRERSRHNRMNDFARALGAHTHGSPAHLPTSPEIGSA